MVLRANKRKSRFWLVTSLLLYACIIHNYVQAGIVLDFGSVIGAFFITLLIIGELRGRSAFELLKKAYKKPNRVFDKGMIVIERGKIKGNIAYAVATDLDTLDKYSIIFAKGKKQLIEYNKSFEGSTLAEVSDYLDYVAEQI